jgi:hypothetical protein
MVVLAHAKTNTLTPVSGCTDRSPARRPGRQRIKQATRAEIMRLYELGLSTRAVAAQTHVARTTVLQVLVKAAVHMRPRGTPAIFSTSGSGPASTRSTLRTGRLCPVATREVLQSSVWRTAKRFINLPARWGHRGLLTMPQRKFDFVSSPHQPRSSSFNRTHPRSHEPPEGLTECSSQGATSALTAR